MPGDTIIRNGLVLTCDGADRSGRLTLLVREGRIAEIAEDADALQGAAPGARIVDAAGMIITPGFVNAHMHTESLLLRARTAGRHAALWEKDPQIAAARRLLGSPEGLEDLRLLYLGSCFEHLRHGTTTFGDFPPDVQERGLIQLLQAVDRSDLHAVIALLNWDQIRQARDLGTARPPFLVHLGKAEDLTVYSFENAVRTADDFDVPILAHLAELDTEAETLRKNFQKSPLAILRDFGALTEETLLAHANHIDAPDLDLLEESGASVVLCTRSAMFKQTGYPSLRGLLRRRVRFCLGTDWGHTDMLAEMRFVSHLPLLFGGLPRLSSTDILRMATINGARALGLAADTGSIERGKSADLTFLHCEGIGIPPLPEDPTTEELADHLVASLAGRDVTDVMIGGEFYLRDGQTMTMSGEDILGGMKALRHRCFPDEPDGARGTKIRVIPLVPDARSADDTPKPFEEGTPAPPEEERSPRRPPPERPPQPERPPGQRPELAKDVRRVFGDDDF